MPEQSAGPQLPGWRTADEAREKTRTALSADEELKQTIANRPRLQRAKGWKGALQTVGEMFLNPAVIHPNYTRQMEEYGQDVDAAEARAKITANQAEQVRRQAIAEAQGEHYGAQSETERRKQADIDRKAGMPEYMPISEYGGIFNKTAGEVVVAPRVREPKPVAPTREEMDAAGTARRMKEADQLGLKGNDRINYIAGKNVIRPPKAGGSGGGGMSPANARAIEARKNADMLAAKREAQREENKILAMKDIDFLQSHPGIDASVAREQMRQKVWDDDKNKMEQIQQGYEGAILATGGSIAPRQAAAASPAGPARPAPALNAVVDGFRYVGGDPHSKSSWVPVK